MTKKIIKVDPSIHQKLLKVVNLRNRVSEEMRKEGVNVTVLKWEQEDIINQALQSLIEVWRAYYPELIEKIMENGEL
jgi:hypothetical protein